MGDTVTLPLWFALREQDDESVREERYKRVVGRSSHLFPAQVETSSRWKPASGGRISEQSRLINAATSYISFCAHLGLGLYVSSELRSLYHSHNINQISSSPHSQPLSSFNASDKLQCFIHSIELPAARLPSAMGGGGLPLNQVGIPSHDWLVVPRS